MNDIKSLMGRAQKYIESAEVLIEKGDFDSSVSRSYYAMFYAAEALLLTKNLKFSSHRSVITLFGEHFIKAGIFKREMGKRLRNAFDIRLVGDYSFTPQHKRSFALRYLPKFLPHKNLFSTYIVRQDGLNDGR